MKVVFYEVFNEEEKCLRRHLPESIEAEFIKGTIQSSKRTGVPPKLVSIRTQSFIPLDWGSQVSGVLSRSAGFDHLVAWRKASKSSIPLGYLPGYSSRAVAEHAMLMMMALLRNMKRQIHHFSSFDRDNLTGKECVRRRLLVVGVGRIGGEIVRLASALGMNVRGVDPVKKVDGLKYTDLKDGVSWADLIVCALPLDEKTRGLLGAGCLEDARPGSILVNISRGEITPMNDLKGLLRKGTLGGVALDVYEDEARLAQALRRGGTRLNSVQKDLLKLGDQDNVILTPHNAFNTEEALDRKSKQTVESIIRFIETGQFSDKVSVQ